MRSDSCKAFTVRISGQRWRLLFKRSITHNGDRCDGLYLPNQSEIHIDETIRGRLLYEASIHETLHASGWHLHEDVVRFAARFITFELYPFGVLLPQKKRRPAIRSVLSFAGFGLSEEFVTQAATDILAVQYHPAIRGRN